jgi:hypothetical protein
VHLAAAQARCERVAEIGQRNIRAVLGDQPDFTVAVQAASVGPVAAMVQMAACAVAA